MRSTQDATTSARAHEGQIPSVALVGCGRWGRNIAKSLSRHGALKVIVDAAPDFVGPFAGELSVDVTNDLDAVLADASIEAVAIAAPAADHARLVLSALKAGKHVFVEKPLALTVEDAVRCAEAAEQAGRVLMVGHLLQYHPAFVRLLELVSAGEIGRVRHITSHRLNPGAIRTEENALWSLAPHDFSMVLRLAEGEPIDVRTLAVGVVDPAIPDQYTVLMRFAGDVSASVYCSWLSPYKEHKLVVLGESGAIVFEDTAEPGRKLLLFRDHIDRSAGAPQYRKGPGEAIDYPASEPLMDELGCFLDVIRGRGATRTGPSEAIPVLRLLTRADAAAIQA